MPLPSANASSYSASQASSPTGAGASLARMMEKVDALRASMPDSEDERRDRLSSRKTSRRPSASGRRPSMAVRPSGAGRESIARNWIESPATTMTDHAQMVTDYEVVRHRYEEALKENEVLKVEQQRRMESYLRREQEFETRIRDLQAELERQSSSKPPADVRMKQLREEHRKVMHSISSMQVREQGALQDQEKDLLRAFRARLWDVQFELENERSKKDDGALEWIEKTRTLGKELDWSREEALRLDRINQQLTRDNQRLKAQLRSQEDDREFVVRQVLALKKENLRLKALWNGEQSPATRRASVSSTGALMPMRSVENVSGMTPSKSAAFASSFVADGAESMDDLALSEAASNAAHPANIANSERVRELTARLQETEERYREVVSRLKRLLDVERKNLRAVRGAHAKDLQSRTELEVLLRACVDDVRKEVSHARSAEAAGAAACGSRPGSASRGKATDSPSRPSSSSGERSARMAPTSELGRKDRERVLELLLSQERVVSLLYDRAFPPKPVPNAADEEGLMDDTEVSASEAELLQSLGQ
ncbi:hypothetical protein AB1Y20_016295 [Prymnesium parvum]|uniref:Cilia- and flagella-associated protein 157 n=1 Tax=Prymnesium parvum TaxID=97485 RepID=A0AB34IFI9_PRYPA